MLKKILIAIPNIVLLLGAPCSSSAPFKDVRDLTPFNRIESGGLVNINLIQSNKYKAEISAEGIDLKDIFTQVHNSTLIVKTIGNHSNEIISIDIFHRGIDALKTAGNATVTSSNTLVTDALTVEISDNGDAELLVDVETLNIDMRGNGDLTVIGRAQKQQVRSHGGGGSFDNSNLNTGALD